MQKGKTKLSDTQNFITDPKLIQRIVRIGGIRKEDVVIEIGTGKGHLTQELCRRGGYVRSIELDRGLYESACRKLSKLSNLELVHGDFLQYPLPQRGAYKVFSNIPYNITTKITDKLSNAPNPAADIWLIMEKGAAKRFLGIGRETEKSLLLKVHWESEIRYHFRREDFHPMPSVDSVLVHFSRKEAPDLNKKDYAAFQGFVKAAMRHGLCGKKGLLTKRQADVALKRAGLPPARQDGVTLYIQWLCLFRCRQQISRSGK
ncbi:MAG: 23S ribosomal RNA methyltransferase Erm [Roseburia sp.]|nr:23S ribosomal RNA methyltransferase Erm [Roseburia sp.]